MNSRRLRLDQALVELRLAPSRNRARSLVMAGQVKVAGHRATKAGMMVREGVDLVVLSPPRFVGRGGDKLAAALAGSGIDPAGKVCLDVGASTGGFTDCLLQTGARLVLAVDVGYGQLDWRLRQDDRVVVLERTNARYLEPSTLPRDLPHWPRLLVIDVSFIGIAKVLPAVGSVCDPHADALLLVKPQFECGPHQVGAGGVVRDPHLRRAAVRSVATSALDLGWSLAGAIPSPVRGAAGNWECFLHLRRPPPARPAPHPEQTIRRLEVPDDRQDVELTDTDARGQERP
ncbi:MAG: TlyA family RNA methyltransferase [Acidobacteriota bacterium]